MVKTKKIFILGLLLITAMIQGCWDKVEINERAFVTAVGIDKHINDEDRGEEKEEEEALGIEERDRYTVSYIFPNISAIGKGAGGEPKFVVSSVGISPYETTRQLRTRLHQIMFFQHMKIAVIGEQAAKDPQMMKEIMDSLERNKAINRRINVLITRGKAQDVLNVESQFESDVGIYLSNIFEAAEGTARFNPQSLGDLLKTLHGDENALMPRITVGENDVKVAGSAIIKKFKLIGWLGEVENRSVLFLKDRVSTDVVISSVFKDKIIIPYLVTSSNTSKSAEVKDDKITMKYKIEMEGELQQFILDTPESVLDDKLLKEIEKNLEKKLKGEIMEAVDKLQDEFKVDVIGVNEYLSKFKPDIWETVENDWENIFPNIDIEVEVEAKIRRVGLTR